MSEPITDDRLIYMVHVLNDLDAELEKHTAHDHSLQVKSKGVHYVEMTLVENAQAHVKEAAVAIGRIILNR